MAKVAFAAPGRAPGGQSRDPGSFAWRALAAVALLCSAAPAGGGTFDLVHTVVDPAHARNDFFASALGSRGLDIVAGARFDDRAATDAGAAYLIDAVTGTVRLDFRSPTPAVGDQFGAAVASLGDDVLVGAPHVDDGGPHAGAVYLFDGQTGAHLRTFRNPNPDLAELFGFSLGVVSGQLLIGAPFYNAQVRASGATYLFDAASGALARSFRNPRPEEYDLFGQAVAAVGGDVLVGAPFDDSAAADAGAVYLLDPVQRIPLRTFTSPNAHAGDFFGAAVAATGNLVLVGAPFDDTAASDSGAAYLFDATTGALVRSFLDPASNVDGRFGTAVAWRGQQALIGAPFADAEAIDAGIAYLFDATTGDLVETFANPTPADGDQFGATVTVAGADVVVGAWLDDTAAPNAGALYVFRDTTPPTTTTVTTAPTTTAVTTTATVTETVTTETAVTTTASSTTSSETLDTTTTSATASTVTVPPPSTTTTTGALGETTTSTEPAALSCEDGDACTTDAVTPGGECLHAPLGVPDGALCQLTALAAMLEAEPAAALGGRRRRARLLRRVASARHLLEQARSGKSHPQRRARRSIAELAAVIRRAAHAGTIDPRLAARLLARATRARAEL